MNKKEYDIFELIKRYPLLDVCKDNILEALELLKRSFANGNKLLIAGNGGSCADAEHIVGELMKGFKKKRPLNKELSSLIESIDPVAGKAISEKLQQGFPTIALHNHQSLNTAFMNDVVDGANYCFAQQVLNYGKKGDVFLGISTSGNSINIYNACVVAKAKGIKIIGLTGKRGGLLGKIADISINVPSEETFIIQEYHLPVYHYLCLELENYFWGNNE